jgi:hypothetical protein
LHERQCQMGVGTCSRPQQHRLNRHIKSHIVIL